MTDTFDEPRRPTLRAPADYEREAKHRDEIMRRIEIQVRLNGGVAAALSNLTTEELDQLLRRLRQR